MRLIRIDLVEAVPRVDVNLLIKGLPTVAVVTVAELTLVLKFVIICCVMLLISNELWPKSCLLVHRDVLITAVNNL